VAMIAIPRVSAPTWSAMTLGKSAGRFLAPTAAAALFLVALAAVIMLIGPGGPPSVRVTLKGPYGNAPKAWRDALGTGQGTSLTETLVRLTVRPEPISAASLSPGPSTTKRAVPGGPLPPAPIAGFFAPGPGGPLPIIAPDGRTPFQAYARPFLSNGRPKVAMMVGGLGLNARATRQAIETLPPEITLAFVPYAEGLQGWIDMARAHGHEVLLETPMEPVGYPDNDPGPYTLMADAEGPETAKKLEWILSRTTGYFGLTNYLGSRFLAQGRAYDAFAGALRSRGLGFIDDGLASRLKGGGIPRASADRVIDDQLTRPAIDRQLLALEAAALERGHALGSGFAYPVTLEMVARWSQGLDQRGYQLAPASALATTK
jgi:uncharacterized protein